MFGKRALGVSSPLATPDYGCLEIRWCVHGWRRWRGPKNQPDPLKTPQNSVRSQISLKLAKAQCCEAGAREEGCRAAMGPGGSHWALRGCSGPAHAPVGPLWTTVNGLPPSHRPSHTRNGKKNPWQRFWARNNGFQDLC